MLFTVLASQPGFDEFGRSSRSAASGTPARKRNQPASVLCWPLAAGEAVTFRARRAGQLHATGGPVWLTYSNNGRLDSAGQVDTTHAHPGRLTGDFVLAPGKQFALAAGETVVLQAWCTGARSDLQWHTGGANGGQPIDARRNTKIDACITTSLRWLTGLATPGRLTLRRLGLDTTARRTEPQSAWQTRPFEAAASDPSTQYRLY